MLSNNGCAQVAIIIMLTLFGMLLLIAYVQQECCR